MMTPTNGPPKINFSMAQLSVPLFYDNSRYLTDKYSYIVWGCHPPRGPPKWTLKNEFFEGLKLRCQCFMISADLKLTRNNLFRLDFM